jgi:hypothetical protein
MAKRQQANLLLAGGVALCTGPVEGPLVIGVVVHPLAKVVSKVKAPEGEKQRHHDPDLLEETGMKNLTNLAFSDICIRNPSDAIFLMTRQ